MNAKIRLLTQALIVILPLLPAPFCQATQSIYMKAGNIPGECVAEGHEDWCHVMWYNFDVDYPTRVNIGDPAPTMSLGPIQVTKPIDQASSELAREMANRNFLEYLWIEVAKPVGGGSEVVYLGYAFSNVLVSHIDWENSSEGDVSLETITFEYDAYLIAYRYKLPTGEWSSPCETGWNQATNQGRPLPPMPPGIRSMPPVMGDHLSIGAPSEPETTSDPAVTEDRKVRTRRTNS